VLGRRRPSSVLLLTVAAMLLLGCRGDADVEDVEEEQPDEAAAPAAPGWLETDLREDAVALAWPTVEGAEEYRLVFDGEPFRRIGPPFCGRDDVCVVVLDRTRVVEGPYEATVRAVVDGVESPDSASVTVEAPPEAEPPEHPAAVTVTRQGPDPGDPPRFEYVEAEPGESAEELLERLEEELADDDEVVSIDIEGRVDPLGIDEAGRDPPEAAAGGDWPGRALQLSTLADTATGEGVTIALIDLGDVDRSHPELADVEPVRGIGPDGPSDAQSDTSAHATAVAGAILGTDLVTGTAPGATVIPYDIGVETATDAAMVNAITHAVVDGADVINLSVSSTSRTHDGVQRAIDLARSNGVVVIAGAGNHAADHPDCTTRAGREHGRPTMPAAAEGILRVGASDASGARWRCSVPFDDAILAPGADVPLLDVGSRAFWVVGPLRHELRVGDGTSYASPLVAGVAGLLLELDPGLPPDRLAAALRLTVSETGVIDPGLAVALHDPEAPALSIGVHEREARRRGGLYFSLTAVTSGERLVGVGSLYHAFRSVIPERTYACTRGMPPSVYRIDQVITATGAISSGPDRDEPEVRLDFSPSEPAVVDFSSCRDEGYREQWFSLAEQATSAIAGAEITVPLGRSAENGDVAAGVYEGRCEPVRAQIVGGCDNPTAAPTRQELLADPDLPIPDADRP
jgi:subtilisin family serine protease